MRSTLGRRLAILAVPLLASLAGCKIVSIQADDEARARRSDTLDPAAYVGRIWGPQVMPRLQSETVPLPQLTAAIRADVAKAGAAHGRRASDTSPWTFVTRGSGRVTAIDRVSRTGSIKVELDDGGEVWLQTGPVIIDTAIRDALPFLDFNDFADQIVYAGVGAALTQRALSDTAPALQRLKVGDHIAFEGAFDLSASDDPIRITAVQVRPQAQAGA